MNEIRLSAAIAKYKVNGSTAYAAAYAGHLPTHMVLGVKRARFVYESDFVKWNDSRKSMRSLNISAGRRAARENGGGE